ncbi:helix-turn-helix domain-containing protein [Marinobacterium mangrovicola]|uniref:Cro/C1-type helix-turn-helix DNA-binding protein n=1 Tax=Marinobacterium mangrovicola TaxID=1476959 RepID=A0A4R1GKE9_9GAMM|nr:helix-turn-helix transcriptional regulator [Marinobacterium mangrovicola]TCK08548.1 Cro/C1-type helix-turn-helix DNA-binding protein [Marinobacterium mangrovicola]
MTKPAIHEDLAQNLRLLCSYYKSIAEVCRRLDINRPQFNRYLSGQYKPSANTLRRLCEFFGIETHEILLPHNQFERLVQLRPQATLAEPVVNGSIAAHMEQLSRCSNPDIQRYLGYYFEYYLSMSTPGKLLRNLVCLEEQDGQIVFQRTERMRTNANEAPCHNRYQGIVHLLTDRLFLVDYETLNCHEVTQTILFPSFRNRVSKLTGLKMGVSDNSERMPCCARVVYEYLGKDIRLRKALAMCGLYEADSAEIDGSIREAVRNEMAPGETLFRARH